MKTLVTSLILALGLAGCGGAGAKPEVDASAPSAAGAPSLTPAQLATLTFERVAEVQTPDIDDLSGTVEFDEQHTARLAAIAAGHVSELLVQVGDAVVAGQPLLAIESSEVKVAQADWVREEADLTVARRTAERSERLRVAGAIADKDYFQAHEDLTKAEAEFDRAGAQLERLGLTPADHAPRYYLRAPFAGTVVERRALVGMAAAADSTDPLVVVSDLSHLRVTVRLPERQLALVHPGQEVQVRVDAYPEEFTGTVAQIGDVVDDATRTILIRCGVPNPARRLKPEMFARVRLRAAGGQALVAVPTAAVLSDGERFQVVVRRADGGLEVRPVQIGAELGDRVEVRDGLHPGEEIVSEGAVFAVRQLTAS